MAEHRTQIVVTGANGFVGSHLLPYLARRGVPVVALLRRHESLNDSGAGHDNIQVASFIDDYQDLAALLSKTAVVYHLAGCASAPPPWRRQEVESCWRANATLTDALAKSASRNGVQRFIYLSSIHVMQRRHQLEPLNDQQAPQPQGIYARSKYAAEQALRQHCRNSSMQPLILRIPLIYGPGVQGNMRRLMQWLQHGAPLFLDSISNQRSMLALDNLLHLLHHLLNVSVASDKPWLVADSDVISTGQLCRRVRSYLHGDVPPAVFFSRWLLPVMQRFGAYLLPSLFGSLTIDSTTAFRGLAWQPPYRVEEAILSMARAFLMEEKKEAALH